MKNRLEFSCRNSFSAPLLLATSGAYSIGDCYLDGCLDVIEFFSYRYFYSFCSIPTKLGTHDLNANTQKTWNIFSKF